LIPYPINTVIKSFLFLSTFSSAHNVAQMPGLLFRTLCFTDWT